MKYIFVVFIFLTIIAKITLAQSTINDLMRPGFDAVFEYKHEEIIQFLESQSFGKYKSDVFVRKALDDGKFIVHPKNFHYDGNNSPDKPPTPEDLKAMKLPVLLGVNEDFRPDYLKARSDDTNFSLVEKNNILGALFGNMTELVGKFPKILQKKDRLEVRQESGDSPFGICNIRLNLVKTHQLFVVTMTALRSDCTGSVDKNILKKLKAEDLDPTSEYELEFIFKQTSEFHGVNWFVLAKDNADSRHISKMKLQIQYKELQRIEGQTDESQFTEQHITKELK